MLKWKKFIKMCICSYWVVWIRLKLSINFKCKMHFKLSDSPIYLIVKIKLILIYYKQRKINLSTSTEIFSFLKFFKAIIIFDNRHFVFIYRIRGTIYICDMLWVYMSYQNMYIWYEPKVSKMKKIGAEIL